MCRFINPEQTQPPGAAIDTLTAPIHHGNGSEMSVTGAARAACHRAPSPRTPSRGLAVGRALCTSPYPSEHQKAEPSPSNTHFQPHLPKGSPLRADVSCWEQQNANTAVEPLKCQQGGAARGLALVIPALSLRPWGRAGFPEALGMVQLQHRPGQAFEGAASSIQQLPSSPPATERRAAAFHGLRCSQDHAQGAAAVTPFTARARTAPLVILQGKAAPRVGEHSLIQHPPCHDPSTPGSEAKGALHCGEGTQGWVMVTAQLLNAISPTRSSPVPREGSRAAAFTQF